MMGQDIFNLLIAQTWQVAVLAIVAWIAVRVFASDRPHLAHAIWALVLIKCMVPPIMSSPVSPFSWVQARSSQTQSIAQTSLTIEPSHDLSQSQEAVRDVSAVPKQTEDLSLEGNAFKPPLAPQPKEPLEPANSLEASEYEVISRVDAVTQVPTSAPIATKSWPVVLVWWWFVGAAIGLATMAIRFTLFLFWLNKSPAVESTQVEACVEKLRQRLGIRSSVRVKVSARPVGPAVIGVIRPTILLPVAMIENKTDAEIEPLIAHELIHVRRGDLWWAMLQTVATSLFWFHPLVWIASKMLTRESERCCDEETIAGLGCRPAEYARGLLEVLELKHQLRVAPALPGVRPVEITSARLERVMRLGNGIQKRTPVWVWLVMLFCGAVVLPGAAWAVVQEKADSETQTQNGEPETSSASSATTKPKQEEQYQEHRFEVGDLLEKIRDDNILKHSAESILINSLSIFDPIPDPDGRLAVTHRFTRPRGARIIDNQLIANEPPERIKLIQEAIDNYRENGFCQVIAETRFLRLNQDQIGKLGINWEQVKSNSSASDIASTDFDPTGKQPKFAFPSLELPQRDGIHAVSHIDRGTPVLFSVVSEMELQRFIKMSTHQKDISLSNGSTVTMFNGRVASVSSFVQRPFVTAVKEVLGKDGAKAHQPVISLFETGTRLRIRPVVKEDSVEIECHVQLREISDVKTLHLSQWESQESETLVHKFDKDDHVHSVSSRGKDSGEPIEFFPAVHAEGGPSGVSIQSPTLITTNVEVKRSIRLGDTLLLEMLSDKLTPKTDTLIVMLTCRKISPEWGKKSDAEKKQAADRAAAIEAAKNLPAIVKEDQIDEDAIYIKAGGSNQASETKPRDIEVMGQRFRFEGDLKFEMINSGIEISGRQLSVGYGSSDPIGSCEGDGTVQVDFDETGEMIGQKMRLEGRAKVKITESIFWAADSIQYISDEDFITGTLEGNASFHYEEFTGMADRVVFDKTGIVKLIGRASLTRKVDGQPNTVVRGDKILMSGSDEIDGEPKITVDPDEDSTDTKEQPLPEKSSVE